MIEVLDGLLEGCARNLRIRGARNESLETSDHNVVRRRFGDIIAHKGWRDFPHTITEMKDIVIW